MIEQPATPAPANPVFYQIYQLKNCTDSTRIGVCVMRKNYHFIRKANYVSTYAGKKDLHPTKGVEGVLDELFEQFNLHHPNDFNGYSMSVGDVVEIDGVPYLCNTFGWKVLDSF